MPPRVRPWPRPEPERPDGGFAARSRVLQARQEAGLTTKALADRLELSLWATERLERGEADAGPYLKEIAEATGRSTTFFEEDRRTAAGGRAVAAGDPIPSPGEATGADDGHAAEIPGVAGRRLVLASLVALVLVRFFTEDVTVLPRVATFVDIPIFIVLVLVGISRPHAVTWAPARRRPYLALALVLVAVCTVSVLVNSARVDLGPALFFLYGFVAPLALFYGVYRLWPPGGALPVSRVLVALAIIQIAVVFGLQLPTFLASENPDVISGTFGENAYQLVFFLLVLIGLLGSIYTFEKRRPITRFIPVMVVAIIIIIFLAQFRALLITMGLAILMVGALLSGRSPRGAVAAILTMAALLITLAFVAQDLPALKFGAALGEARADPNRYFETRLNVARSIGQLYGDNERYVLTGTGPGTYSSRAWRAFTVDARTSESAAFSPVRWLTGGRPYSTDVSDKYVVPQLETGEIVSGSRAVSTPYSSYLSLLAEVGIFGFLAVVAAYLAAFFAALRMTRLSMRAATPGDPLPALLCASTVAFFVLPQMALLENWLEVTRVTFLSWILLAVATKEFEARGIGGMTRGGLS
jgi:hypothetical protein